MADLLYPLHQLSHQCQATRSPPQPSCLPLRDSSEGQTIGTEAPTPARTDWETAGGMGHAGSQWRVDPDPRSHDPELVRGEVGRGPGHSLINLMTRGETEVSRRKGGGRSKPSNLQAE